MSSKTKLITSTLLISLLLALVISFFRDTACKHSLCRGDFPAFYVAAKIVSQEKIDELYSVDLQAKLEQDYWPSLGDSYLHFFYPPYVAILLKPLAGFSPLVAKIIWLCLSLLFLFCAVKLSIKEESDLKQNSLLIFTLLICFPSNFLAIVAGQFVALSILLFALLGYYLSNEKKGYAKFFLGIVLGFFLFKPNLFLLLFVFLLPFFSVQLVLGLTLIGSLFFLLAAAYWNLFWPIAWLQSINRFAGIEYLVNGFQSVSLLEVNNYLQEYFGETINNRLIFPLFISFLLLLIFFNTQRSALVFFKKNEAAKKIIIDYLLLMLASACLLLNSHALFYELGILVLPALRIIFRKKIILSIKDFALIFCFYLIVALGIVFKEKFFIQALILLPLFLSFYLSLNFRKFFHLRK